MLNFRLENLKNKSKGGIFTSPYFFVLAVILTVTFGLLFLNSFRSYKSDISVLIIPKSESASFQIDQIMENLTDITHRLSFYDRVLFDNREIKDPFSALDKDQRKEQWNESFSIQRLPNSTTLNISVFNKDKAEANKIARQTALSLSEVASRFYNIQTELEFRIIEGPISSSFIRSGQWLILGSITAGIISAFLILFLFNMFFTEIKNGINKNIVKRDFFSLPSKELSESVKNDFATVTMKKALAPKNLPIAEEKIEEPAEIFPALEENSAEEKGEPTDEEYRERLNKLLRGEI